MYTLCVVASLLVCCKRMDALQVVTVVTIVAKYCSHVELPLRCNRCTHQMLLLVSSRSTESTVLRGNIFLPNLMRKLSLCILILRHRGLLLFMFLLLCQLCFYRNHFGLMFFAVDVVLVVVVVALLLLLLFLIIYERN